MSTIFAAFKGYWDLCSGIDDLVQMVTAGLFFGGLGLYLAAIVFGVLVSQIKKRRGA